MTRRTALLLLLAGTAPVPVSAQTAAPQPDIVVETDENRREQLYCDASQIIWDDAPWIFLWTQSFPVVWSDDVTGISATPTEKFSAVYARPAN